MKKLLFILLALVSFNLYAADSGLWYDEYRNGEGLNIVRNGDHFVLFFYSYGAEGCHSRLAPEVGPVFPWHRCDDNGQRWFIASGDRYSVFDDLVTGFLYMPWGQNFPEGEPQPSNPYVTDIMMPNVVGIYVLSRSGDGWRFLVRRFGDALPEDDYLFSRIFDFNTALFPADEVAE